jgi:2-oxoisovalerate dehydrogenase E2 component (dihydrolipoyl transacylase)
VTSPGDVVGTPFLLSDIGEGIKEVELIAWYVTVGQDVEEFDTVASFASDKATVQLTSRYTGTITSLNGHNVGDMIQVGEPILYIKVQNDEQQQQEHQDESTGQVEQIKRFIGRHQVNEQQ